MRLTSLLCLLLFTYACGGGSRKSSFKMGETTRSDVIAAKGEPLAEKSIPIPDSKIMEYPDGEKYQLKGDIVVNSLKYPEGDQKLLLYWKHKFKDCLTSTHIQKSNPPSHTSPEVELSCPAQGISVIYTEGSDIITRVVEHEKK